MQTYNKNELRTEFETTKNEAVKNRDLLCRSDQERKKVMKKNLKYGSALLLCAVLLAGCSQSPTASSEKNPEIGRAHV